MVRRVLVITPQIPYPPDQGAPIRNFYILKYLGTNQKYRVSLLSFTRSDESSEEAVRELAKYCARMEIVPHPPARSKARRLRDMVFDRRPDLALRLKSQEFAARLQKLYREEQPDVILCEALEMAPYIIELVKPLSSRPVLVLDEHNAEYLLQQRAYESDRMAGLRRWPVAAYSFVQTRRLKAYENETLAFFGRALAVSDNDAAAIRNLGFSGQLEVLPNGIDPEAFTIDQNIPVIEGRMVFTGSMDFRPNVDAVTWFAQAVWPMVRRENPQATFYIVGRRPAPAVQALANIPGIVVTGKVLDTRPYLHEAALYVVPMRMGGGVRFKVLEALAAGKAVLTTSMGADGIPVTGGKEVVMADTASEFAVQTLNLLKNPVYRQELGQNGRRFVENRFAWKNITPLLDKILLVNGNSGSL
jgi:sugar transferase (PEP-CTERM/EpsH1 system associated)